MADPGQRVVTGQLKHCPDAVTGVVHGERAGDQLRRLCHRHGSLLARGLQLVLVQPAPVGLLIVPAASLEIDGVGLIECRLRPVDGITDGCQPADPLDPPDPPTERNIGILLVDNSRLDTHQIALGKGCLEGMLRVPPSQPAAEAAKLPVHLFQVELLGIEPVANPLENLLMLIVFGILERIQEVGVAIGTAAVLRRARTLPLDASRVANAAFAAQRLLDIDDVPPIIPEIVIVEEKGRPLLGKVAEPNEAGIPFGLATKIKIGALFAVDHEGVRVRVFPTHANLNDVVQFRQRAVVCLHSSPDRRMDVLKRDLELVDRQTRIQRFSNLRFLLRQGICSLQRAAPNYC